MGNLNPQNLLYGVYGVWHLSTTLTLFLSRTLVIQRDRQRRKNNKKQNKSLSNKHTIITQAYAVCGVCSYGPQEW